MKFSEKVKNRRKALKITQTELGQLVGVSLRTIQNYEIFNMYPKDRDVYYKLADALKVDVNYLLTEGEDITDGTPVGRDTIDLVYEISGLFAGGDIPEEDKDAMMKAITAAYWDSKEKNQKYTPKKFK